MFDQETWLSVYPSVSGGSVMGPALEGCNGRVRSSQPLHPGHDRFCQALGCLHVAVWYP